MKKQFALNYLMSLVGACLLSVNLSAAAFFEDSFDYTGWNYGSRPMSAVWASWQNAPVVERTDKAGYPNRYIKLANGTVSAALPKTLNSDFILTVHLLSTAYGRLHWFGLSNDAGTAGYYVAWDTGLASQFDSQGRVGIGRINISASEPIGYQKPGPFITELFIPGHNRSNTQSAAISPPFAILSLKWNAAQQRLALLVNGAEVSHADNITLGSLSRIHLSGNSTALFSSVILKTP